MRIALALFLFIFLVTTLAQLTAVLDNTLDVNYQMPLFYLGETLNNRGCGIKANDKSLAMIC